MFRNRKTPVYHHLLVLAAAVIVVFSCNKPFPNTLEDEGGDDTTGVNLTQNKVLFIIADGVRGDALRVATIPNLSAMTGSSIYTTNGIADYERAFQPFSNENAWSNLLTGVSQTKHLVTGTDFSGNAFASYPSFFTRLKTARPTLRTAAFTSSASLRTNLLADATASQSLADDAAVKAATLTELKNPDAGLVMAQFKGAQTAGDQFGYDNNVPQYLAAITQVDGYIGELMTELSRRPNAASERWLVIVASGKGGTTAAPPTDVTAYGDAQRNTFLFFYYPKFISRVLEKPVDSRGAGTFKGTTVRLYGNPNDATGGGANIVVQNKVGETDQRALDVGQGPYTFEAKVKFFPKSGNVYTYSNMPFLCKTQQRSGSGTNSGWAFFKNGANITFWFRSDGATSGTRTNTEFNLTKVIADSNWHTIGFTMQRVANSFFATAYVDGVAAGNGTLANVPAGDGITTPAPMRFGFNDNAFSSDYVNMAISDVRVWKALLPDNVIYQYSCLPGLPPAAHPYRSSLAGFWSNRDGSGTDNTIIDQTGNGRDAKVTIGGPGTIQWRGFSEVNNNICPEPESEFFRKVPTSMDVAFQVLRWMGINSAVTDGRAWLTSYDGL